MKFSDLRLAEPILRAVASEGYSTATPIQAQTIPHGLAGRDVLGCAQTGTGKTAAFALPVLHRLASSKRAQGVARQAPRCLVLAPTRELAIQIADSFKTYGQNLPLRHTVIFGGVNQNPQVYALKRGIDVLIATPGRLLDLMGQGYVDLRGIENFVLDEADRMLDMGFINDIHRIVDKLPDRRQTMLFSATMPGEIRQLVDKLLHDPATVQVTPVASTVETIQQSVYFVDKPNKPKLLAHLVEHMSISRAIVFTRTKHGADRVVKYLRNSGTPADAIHGNKTQNARQRALEAFRSGRTHILVATDIAARGIDVDGISHVVNYDLTHEPETYVHRIGRTARAGATGAAISFCDAEERFNLQAIERLIRVKLDVCDDQPESLKATHTAPPAAPPRRGNTGGRNGNRRNASRPPRRRNGNGNGAAGSATATATAPRRRRRRQPGGGATNNN